MEGSNSCQGAETVEEDAGLPTTEDVPRDRRPSVKSNHEVQGDESQTSLDTRKGAVLRNLQQYYDANFTSTTSLGGKKPRTQRRRCIFPKTFTVPTSVVKRAMEILDQSESPDCPGEMRLGEVMNALHRFHSAMGEEKSVEWDLAILEDLGLSTDVHAFDPEMMIEWHAEAVYSRFRVELGTLERLYFALDMGDNSSLLSKTISGSLFVAVFLSTICWMAGTSKVFRIVPCVGQEINSCVPREPMWMEMVEMVCVWIFTAEILLRLICVAQARSELLHQRYLIDVIIEGSEWRAAPRSGPRRFLAFLFSIQAICDVLSVVPFWVETILQPREAATVEELSVLRVLYITRVVRLFKLTRALNADLGQFNEINDLFKKVLANAAPAILMTVLLIVIALFFFGTFIWFCERGEWAGKDTSRYQALVIGDRGSEEGAWLRIATDGLTEELSPFTSIPGAFWWTIVTITTVGYGDQVPTSWLGKAVGSVAMLYGTVILGLPLFVVGATFGQEYNRLMKDAKRREELKSDRSSGKHGTPLRHQRTARFAKATGNFIEEHENLRVAMKEYCPLLAIPEGVVRNWEEGLRVALLEQTPATGIDRLMIRVLHYLAEVEEYWNFQASKARGAQSPVDEDSRSVRHYDRSRDIVSVETSPKGLSPDSRSCRHDRTTELTIAARLSKCRKLRTMWYRLAITGCQLGMVPAEVLAKALEDCGGFCSGKAARKRGDSSQSYGSATSPTARMETSPSSIRHGSSDENADPERKMSVEELRKVGRTNL